jgi:hypothetical protein
MLLRPILAYHISLLWSSCLWVTFRIYKHSAPPELKRWLRARLLRLCDSILEQSYRSTFILTRAVPEPLS